MKIGILTESNSLCAWQLELCSNLAKLPGTQVWIIPDKEASNPINGSTRPSKLFDILTDRGRECLKGIDNALDRTPLNELQTICGPNAQLSFLVCAYDENEATCYRHIAEVHFDIIIAFTACAKINRLAKLSRYGVWYFWHAFEQSVITDGSTVGAWEFLKRRPTICSALLISTDRSPETYVAYKSYSAIYRYSYPRTRNEILWKIAEFIPRSIRQLDALGAKRFFLSLEEGPSEHAVFTPPQRFRLSCTNLIIPLSLLALRQVWAKMKAQIFSERWTLMFQISERPPRPNNFRLITPPRGRFWADPHVIRRGKLSYVYFEDASTTTGKGDVSFLTISEKGEISPAITVLQEPYHLSYPFIFEWGNEIYMVPESAETRSVRLYRFTRFPSRLEFQYTMLDDMHVYDATLVEHSGIWWMFCVAQKQGRTSTWDELSIFFSDSPVSRSWAPHPRNPVISDVRCARPAGALFYDGHKLIRPSQDSSIRYGHRINFSEIEELTTTSYRERIVRSIDPDWNRSIKALHTWSNAGHLTIIDAVYQWRH